MCALQARAFRDNTMKASMHDASTGSWDPREVTALIKELWSLRASMVAGQERMEPWLQEADPAHRDSANNLAHYLAMRGTDLRKLQARLAMIGLSSLGRSETHVLANLDKVIGVLHQIAGQPWSPLQQDEPAGFHHGPALLTQHAQALFGAPPTEREVRIMVTLPSEAALDAAMVHNLVVAGMDIARINCAHDSACEWVKMAENVRLASRRVGRPVRVHMDLAGPKLRTGPIAGGLAVAKLQPARNALGQVMTNARLGLRPAGSTIVLPGADVCLGADAEWLSHLKDGDQVELTDARGADRRLTVTRSMLAGALLECDHTVYLTGETRLRIRRKGSKTHETVLKDIPVPDGKLRLQRGQVMRLVSDGLGHGAVAAAKGRRPQPATVACTLPEALAHVRKGERIWFDDGRIGGVVLQAGAKRLQVEITEARDSGENLASDKGINLPDTHLGLPALTTKDLQDLDVVAKHADVVGLSFAQSAADVRALRQHLADRGAAQLGLILKIETRRGFEHLPEMLFAAMTGPAAGVMIARGDLAVECGYERMAEVQEEMLWACEAAHMPVVWATQVLETLARTGLPTRAEITDAAMGGRAECVMLNKGPHILDAMRTLDDILRRMQTHQSKKRSMLRALKAWKLPDRPPVALGADGLDPTTDQKEIAP